MGSDHGDVGRRTGHCHGTRRRLPTCASGLRASARGHLGRWCPASSTGSACPGRTRRGRAPPPSFVRPGRPASATGERHDGQFCAVWDVHRPTGLGSRSRAARVGRTRPARGRTTGLAAPLLMAVGEHLLPRPCSWSRASSSCRAPTLCRGRAPLATPRLGVAGEHLLPRPGSWSRASTSCRAPTDGRGRAPLAAPLLTAVGEHLLPRPCSWSRASTSCRAPARGRLPFGASMSPPFSKVWGTGSTLRTSACSVPCGMFIHRQVLVDSYDQLWSTVAAGERTHGGSGRSRAAGGPPFRCAGIRAAPTVPPAKPIVTVSLSWKAPARARATRPRRSSSGG
jgi:hypothetical protein